MRYGQIKRSGRECETQSMKESGRKRHKGYSDRSADAISQKYEDVTVI